ncbi:MAG: carboxypeptidase M32 [Pseudomonadota bacterium]
MTAYEHLTERFARHAALSEAAGMLHWDSSTLMPRGGSDARTEQLTALNLTCHELITASEVGDHLAQADAEQKSGSRPLSDWETANLREMRRLWLHATALPEDLVAAQSRANSHCEMLWREARPAADYAMVLPALKEVLSLSRQEASVKAEALGCSPYDALLDLYEPGGSAAEIDVIFDDIAAFLPDFLEQVLTHQGKQPTPQVPSGPFPIEKQEALGRQLMGAVGFDFDFGRLDVSLHPFCGGVPDDVRITTRYDVDDFAKSLMGVLHETGHALYERGLPQEWRRQPVGTARGMAMHESQSLLIEMQACRSAAFVAFLAPLAKEAFGGQGPTWEADNLIRLYNQVKPDFIRVDADEVTYPAHIILRYRLEKALIAGEMELEDLPAAWNEQMRGLLGLVPPHDGVGCLQDIHWYDGAWGYFPTYSLGAMTAAQLFHAAVAEVPEIPDAIGRGDFSPLMAWLREKVHGLGSLLSTPETIKQATGQTLDPEIFKNHLRQRYLP